MIKSLNLKRFANSAHFIFTSFLFADLTFRLIILLISNYLLPFLSLYFPLSSICSRICKESILYFVIFLGYLLLFPFISPREQVNKKFTSSFIWWTKMNYIIFFDHFGCFDFSVNSYEWKLCFRWNEIKLIWKIHFWVDFCISKSLVSLWVPRPKSPTKIQLFLFYIFAFQSPRITCISWFLLSFFWHPPSYHILLSCCHWW